MVAMVRTGALVEVHEEDALSKSGDGSVRWLADHLSPIFYLQNGGSTTRGRLFSQLPALVYGGPICTHTCEFSCFRFCTTSTPTFARSRSKTWSARLSNHQRIASSSSSPPLFEISSFCVAISQQSHTMPSAHWSTCRMLPRSPTH